MSKTVIVGCKIPTGLVLQLRDEANPSQVKAQVVLQGTVIDMAPYVRENAVGITEVDADFWEAWENWAIRTEFAPYAKGFVFSASKAADIKAEAIEKANEFTRLERLQVPLKDGDPVSRDPRLADLRNSGLTEIKK